MTPWWTAQHTVYISLRHEPPPKKENQTNVKNPAESKYSLRILHGKSAKKQQITKRLFENGNICVGGLLICTPTESRKKCPDRHSGPGLLVIHQNRDQRASFRIV